jgi:DNA recombination protein RmuC
MEFLAWLVVGIVVGSAAGWVVLRSRQGEQSAEATAEVERARAEAERARTDAAKARAEASQVATEVAQAQREAAEARSERSSAQADLAEALAAARGAIAERNAAVARAQEIAADRAKVVDQFRALSAETVERQGRQLDASAEVRLKATEQLLAPVRDSLQRFSERITQIEKERVVMAAQLADQVLEVRRTGDDLRRETAALVTAMRKPQVRGTWGELQLRRVVELAGMVEHCDFVLQETTHTSAGATIRPDLKVVLSEGRFIYVDSKVPLSAFLEAHEAAEEAERARLLAQFGRHVMTHVDQLSRKDYYKAEGTTPEYVVLFLGSEALAAEAFTQLPSLLEYAADRNVVIATPSSLIATLKSAAYAWRQAALAESARQVSELGRELYDRLGVLGKHFDKIGRALTTAVSAYNETVGSIESRVFPTARKLRELGVTARELPSVSASEAAVRPLTGPELVEDAAGVAPMIGRSRSGDELALSRRDPGLDELLVDAGGRGASGEAHTA